MVTDLRMENQSRYCLINGLKISEIRRRCCHKGKLLMDVSRLRVEMTVEHGKNLTIPFFT